MPSLTWLLLGALGLGAYYVIQQQNAWPPSASVQSALQAQIQAQYQQTTGQPMSAALVQQLQQALAGAPAQYQATLPAGTQPTVAGYQAWVLAKSSAALSVAAPAPAQQLGFFPPAGYQTAGPLGLQGPNPQANWDVYGNAFFTDAYGRAVAVSHENLAPADYIQPVHLRGFEGSLHLRRKC